ncbi:MAG: hypothetical protein PWQ12_393 [Clostridiales bacterium]|jgi:hypothetical protein|nr:hypothetical protein [Clostridiales bacterium]
MKVGILNLQLSGIDIANLKETELLALIREDCHKQGCKEVSDGTVDVYINIEGTAVTAYYDCEGCKGAVRLN